MNENKERIPTKYTWNPSDNNIFLKTAARRYSLASWYCNGTSTHLYVINDLQNSKIVDFIVTIYGNGGCRTLFYMFDAYISQSLR